MAREHRARGALAPDETEAQPPAAESTVVAYADFLARKAQLDGESGFDPVWMPDYLFPFQAALVEWAVRQGRAALFADCGLGKTPMQLAWAENMRRKHGRPVLIVAPLAVTFQVEAEAEKFGVDATTSRDGAAAAGITVTNYDRLQHFDPADFGAVVCDESSAIKAFDGQRRALVTEFLRRMPHRLLCTATAAPNDYAELGTSSEALGYLGYQDMLSRFFVNDAKVPHGHQRRRDWRLKGHAEQAFWRWVSSWARAMRRPSDLGFCDDGFELPALEERQHVIDARTQRDGALFDMPAIGLHEEREELRRTIDERCERAAELLADADAGVAWCHLNDESGRLAFRRSGENPVAIAHPHGLTEYAGERQIPEDLAPYRGWTGKQTENRWSHWIWRQYASAFWDDVRLDRVLPFREARAEEDEKHVHPLQLDVIDRALVLWSNPGENVLTPFMGVGSEVYGAVCGGRRGVGIELKPTYYRQAIRNLATAGGADEAQAALDVDRASDEAVPGAA